MRFTQTFGGHQLLKRGEDGNIMFPLPMTALVTHTSTFLGRKAIHLVPTRTSRLGPRPNTMPRSSVYDLIVAVSTSTTNLLLTFVPKARNNVLQPTTPPSTMESLNHLIADFLNEFALCYIKVNYQSFYGEKLFYMRRASRIEPPHLF